MLAVIGALWAVFVGSGTSSSVVARVFNMVGGGLIVP